MGKIRFSELVNIHSLEKMAKSLYAASGIPLSIVDVDGTIHLKVGWQDICTKFHRVHPLTCNRCKASDMYIKDHLMDGIYIEYKCLNNMWHIAVPIIIAGEHLATVFMTQFFYEDETVDVEAFRQQALRFGFAEEKYLEALSRVSRFSKEKIEYIIEYYLGLVMTLAESGLRELESRNSKKELSRNQRYLSTVLNSVNDSIFIFDFYGKIIDVNQTATIMFGYSSNDLKNLNVIDMLSEKWILSKSQIIEIFNKTNNNSPVMVECICKDKDNKEFWAEVNISTTNIEDKKEMVATVRDITDRKLNELAMQKEAQEMEVLRTEFFANISHELKTPLNIIFGAIQIIEMELENKEKNIKREKIMNNLNIEKQNCFRLLRLINNLIDSTKLDSGYLEMTLVNCNIVSIVEEITLSVAEYISNNNLNVTFDTDVEEKIMACDLDKIERIMLNLLSNAVKFTPDGGEIFVNIFDGKEYITITVEDTGIGIPAAKLNIIFDRFRQVDKSFARKHEGSGIGLSLVKSLVEMHGGRIFVESRYGVGTKFTVEIPVKILNDTIFEKIEKKVISSIDSFVERIKIEFSDIYK